jgi:hypothetical protein
MEAIRHRKIVANTTLKFTLKKDLFSKETIRAQAT